MVKIQGKSRLAWDLLVIVVSIYQAISIPLTISFNFDILNIPEIKTVDSMIDLIFIFDILLHFRTTFIDPISGEEVLDTNLIAKKYVFSKQFIIDILSTIPFNDLIDERLSFFGILKILRVFRINTVIMNMN